jgi:hypothetical protein
MKQIQFDLGDGDEIASLNVDRPECNPEVDPTSKRSAHQLSASRRGCDTIGRWPPDQPTSRRQAPLAPEIIQRKMSPYIAVDRLVLEWLQHRDQSIDLDRRWERLAAPISTCAYSAPDGAAR